ncbi:MAG: hypothetical protein CMO80_12715 [Verrucomicrobiales bacterium]|nr:hypothetical protein [Verrucomicrobiales bacterium]
MVASPADPRNQSFLSNGALETVRLFLLQPLFLTFDCDCQFQRLLGQTGMARLLPLMVLALVLGLNLRADERPNIILIMADDMGWSDLGCCGGEIDTPNIDSLAYDGMATCLDLAGLDYPKKFNQREPVPMEGKSLKPIFNGKVRKGHNEIGWKCGKGRALMSSDWKLVRARDNKPWELYDLASDVGETQDLAMKHPERVKDMAARYQAWRKRVGAR